MSGPGNQGSINDEERELWRIGEFECVMVSCCSGAELQLRCKSRVLLRELYPDKSDLYERARVLREEYEATDADRSGVGARSDGSADRSGN
jgi:hypothetical protein